MKRILALMVVVFGAAAALALYPRGWLRPVPSNQLTLSGNIEAHESLISFKVTGRVVDLPINEGQTVKANDFLARLDDDDYQQQVTVDEAATRLRQYQLALGLAGTRTQEIEAAKQSVYDAQADLAQKQKDLARYQALYEKDEITGQVRDQAATSVTRAQAAYARAQLVLGELVEGTRREQLAVDRANVRQAGENQAMSKIRLGYTVLRAPFDGVVLVRQAELGEVVAPGAPILTLADLVHVWVRVYVPETDLDRVRWGQPVVVRTDTEAGKSYAGRVSFISSEAEFTPKSVQTQKERVTLVYRVKVDVDNPRFELKPGMPADVTIEVR